MSGDSSQGKEKRSPEGARSFEELQEYFDKGKSFTQELMKENERLRLRVLQLEKEGLDAGEVENGGRLARLEEENRRLRGKLEYLETRFGEIERENRDFARQYVEIQAQNDNLLNLYVASYQLHSTLNPAEVVQVIQEIILNLIGVEEYFVCMVDSDKGCPVMLAGEGPSGPLEGRRAIRPDPVLERVLREGVQYFRGEGENSPHLACTPLKVRQDVVGAISIGKLMEQKQGSFSMIDHELLTLLSDHAATALMSSTLYHRTERKLRTIEGFIELLKADRKKG